MTIKRIFPIAFGVAMIAVASVQGYAFMMATSEAPAHDQDVIAMVEKLEAEVKNEEVSCEKKLSMIDAALNDVDKMLDSGVENEAGYLAARDSLVELRLNLSCYKSMAVTENGELVSEETLVADSTPMLTSPVVTGEVAPAGFVDGGFLGGGGGGVVGGGGGAGVGGGFGLLAAGAAAAVAIPLATSDDDAAGTPATASN